MKRGVFYSIGLAVLLLAATAVISGCVPVLTPQFSYQGRLTDAGGAPLNGSHKFIFKVYSVSSGGTSIYTETKNINVTDGLFDTAVGPATFAAGMSPKDVSKPLWLEVTVSNGTYTETLTPRQRLYGAPYAFTLMPGAFISATMDETTWGANGLDAVLTIQNNHTDPGGNPALPALRVFGERSLEIAGPGTGDDGKIYSRLDAINSDLIFYSEDEIDFYLDTGDDSAASFSVFGSGGNCHILENGNLSCTGTKSAVVEVDDSQRLLYAIESPEVWFEDFGSGQLTGGAAVVTVDSLFAKSVNLSVDYHVFLTPLGDCNGLYVSSKTATGFEVRELGGGVSDIKFDYRIVAKRAEYEAVRMESLPSTQDPIIEAGGK